MDLPNLQNNKEEYSSYTEYIDQSINDLLPEHILSQIFSYLSFKDFTGIAKTCTMWRRICFTIASSLTSFEIGDLTPVESAMNLFNRFVEWRIGYIRKVNMDSISLFVNCGYKFTGVKHLQNASSMTISGFPNVERVKELDITSTFFGNMYLYPGLESIKFLNLKDGVIDFFHCSMFGLTLIESLLPLMNFNVIDRLKLLTNSKLLHSLILYTKDSPQSKVNQFLQHVDASVKQMIVTFTDSLAEDEDFNGDVTFSLSNLEKLQVDCASVRMMNMLQFDPEKLQELKIKLWYCKNRIENYAQPKDAYELSLLLEFHELLNRASRVQSLMLGDVSPLFYRTFDFSKFENLIKLNISEIDNHSLTLLAPKLENLKVNTITGFDCKVFGLFGSLKKLSIDPKYISKVDIKNLSKLVKLVLISNVAQYSITLNSDSLRRIFIKSFIKNLTINAINLEYCLIMNEIEKLSIRQNKLEYFNIMSAQIKDLSILSFPIPNQGCEDVSPLKKLYLSNCFIVRQLHCPYLKTVNVKSMEILGQLVELDQTPLIEKIVFERAFIEPDLFKRCVDYFENLKTIEFSYCNLVNVEHEDFIFYNSTIEVINIIEGTSELSKFLTTLFSKSPSVKYLYCMETDVDQNFVESISQPQVDDWKNLEVLSLQNCENITGKTISDFYSNIEHYSNLKYLTLILSPGNETVYDARFPQTLEYFTGLFNSVEIVPTPTSKSNIVKLKSITLDARHSTFSNFEINTFLKSLFDLFVDDKEEMAPFRSELDSLLTYEEMISESESAPPDFKLICKVVAGITSIRKVSKYFFTDDPISLLYQRPNLKLCDF